MTNTSGKQLLKEQRSLQGHCSIRGQGKALHWHDRKHFQDKIYTAQVRLQTQHGTKTDRIV